MTYMATRYRKNPCPKSMKVTLLGHNHYILSLPDLCLGVSKKIFKETMYFHNMTYINTP